MLLIYSPKITKRVQYTFDLFFNNLLKEDYALTDQVDAFQQHKGPKFSYAKEAINDELHFAAHHLLFEESIEKQEINVEKWNELPVFFPIKNGAIPFDIFAIAFYLVSRYEEYLPHGRDKHNRYRPENSTAFKHSFLEKPIVNHYALALKGILESRFKDYTVTKRMYSFIPTIDVDNAFAYKYKGLFRTGFQLFKLLIKFQISKFTRRLRVILGLDQDPYDTFDRIISIHQKYNLKAKYFVLLGNYTRYDRNISHKHPQLKRIVEKLDDAGEVGLHPSYKSNRGTKLLLTEKERLKSMTKKEVSISRQHYIRLTFPNTYRELIKMGIKEDFSMGYPTLSGFRASIAAPFYFFDLEKNESSELIVHPFIVMDTTLKRYQNIRSREALEYITPFIEEVKSVGGEFIAIFHNESLGDRKNWRNWNDIYAGVVRNALMK